MNFAGVKSITIPEGDVRSIAIGGVTVWQKLPYDAEVGYVESTGAQYVDTGLTNVADIAATIRLAASSWSGDSTILGVYTGTTRFYSFAIDNGLYACSFGGSWNSSFAPKITGLPTNSFIAASSDISNDGVTINANGTTRSTTRSDGWSGTGNFTIFKRGGAGQTSYAKIKLAMLEIRVAGVLARDFVPVRVGTAGYLYDRANPTGGPSGNGLYGSATGTALVAGPDKNGGAA